MLIKECFNSSINSIRANAVRSFLTALAIIIGTASVTAIMGLGESANAEFDKAIDELGGRILSVYAGSSRAEGRGSRSVPLYVKDAEALKQVTKHNWQISPSIDGSRQVKFKKKNLTSRVGGYWPIHFDVRQYDINSGRIFTEDENIGRKRVAVLGSNVPKELGTDIEKILNQQIQIAGIPFKVIGILKEEGSSGGWSRPDDEIYIPLLTAKDRVFGRPTIESISVKIPNSESVEYAMMSIEQILRQQHNIGPGENNDFRINDWTQYSDLRKETTQILTVFIAGIAAISLLVGGIGVMNIMLVSVTERTKEIGIRKAVGATQKAIMLQFIIEAVLICSIGGLIGAFFGLFLLYIFTAFNDWIFNIPVQAMFGAIVFSAIVGIFFGVWPAKKAAKLDPAISLRYE